MRPENIVTLVASKDEGNEGKRNERTQILSALLSASALGVFLEGCGGEDTSSGGALPAAPAVRGSESTPLVGTAVEGETFTGTAGKDWVSYAGSTIDAGVTIDLDTLDTDGAATGSGGWAAGDKLKSINNLIGSKGVDTLTGNNLANTLRGGLGADTLEGGGGADTLDGGEGTEDTASYSGSVEGVKVDLSQTDAQEDFDGAQGFTANQGGDAVGDTLENIENLEGSGQADWLLGNGGVNDLSGGLGDDRLEGGAGADTLEGGAGTDTYAFNAGDGTDTIDDDGGNIVFNQGTSDDYEGATYTFVRADDGRGKAVTLTVSKDGKTLNVIEFASDPSSYTFYTRSGSTDSEITLPAVPAREIAGSGGDDILEGGAGTDIIAGGAGDDTLEGGAGDDTLEGGAGTDTYVFNAGDGTDTIDDDGGNIVFNQGASNDYADATYTFVRADDGRGDAVTLTISKDSNTLNVIEFASDPSSYTFYTRSGSSDSDITSSLPAVPAKRFEGSVGDDNLEGGAGTDILAGGAGDDTLEGGAGDDTLEGGAGTDTYVFNAGDGTDTIDDDGGNIVFDQGASDDYANATYTFVRADDGRGDAVTLTVFKDGNTLNVIEFASDPALGSYTFYTRSGSSDSDITSSLPAVPAKRFEGSAGDDNLEGGAGTDILAGGAGDDTLEGGAGDDTLEGGAGTDTYVFNAGDGTDTIDDDGGNIVFDQGTSEDYADATYTFVRADDGRGKAVTLTVSKDGKTLNVIEFANDPALGSYTFYTRSGSSDSDITSSLPAVPAKRFEGSVGDDILEGGAGTDIIAGGAGDDTLEGGAGEDTLEGGAGTDTYVFNVGDGTDTIDDDGGNIVFDQGTSDDYADATYTFVRADDGRGDAVTLTVSKDGKTLNVIEFANDPALGSYTFYTRSGSSDSDITSSLPAVPAKRFEGSVGDDNLEGGAGTDIIAGGAGDDTLEGGAGDDTLEGGAGTDTYVFNAGDGTDTIDDDGGNIVFDQGTSEDYADATYTFVRADDGRGKAVTLTVSKDGKTLNVIEFANDPALGSYTFYTRSGSSDSDITSSLPAVPAKRFEGSVGDDNLEGGAGTDIIAGGAGDDTLEGGAGEDTLEGGAGMDTYVFNAGDGTDTIDDDGGNIVFDQGTSEDYADATYTFVRADDGRGKAVTLTVSKDGKTLNVIEFANDPALGSYTFYTRSGSSDSDITSSLPAVPAKRFEGSVGDDILEGGAGTDIIAGGAGDDTLEGGAGEDTLEGGAGTDTYVFNAGDGTDTIDDDGGNIVFDQGTSDDYADATYTFVRADDITR